MKHRANELTGALLDRAVALAAGIKIIVWGGIPCVEGGSGMAGSNVARWAPSSDWAQGGPIIERERIVLISPDATHPNFPPSPYDLECWIGSIEIHPGEDEPNIEFECEGGTPLVAAMRVYVAYKIGEEVDL